MSKLTRKRVVLAKIESVYATDSTPSTTDAILVRDLAFTPIEAETVQRDNIRQYLGNSDTLLARLGNAIEFSVEMAAAGAAGVAPPWASLLLACGFAETLSTASIAITRTSAVATVTEATHGRAVGDVVKISGAAQTEYNGNQTIVTVPDANTYTFAVSGTPASPATGTVLAGVAATYAPLSTAFPSLSLYFNVDGIRHKMTGARGTVSFDLAAKQIPMLKFKFTGIYVDPTDTALPAADFSAFQIPKVANTTNTPSFSLFSYSGYLESVSLDMACDIQHRTLIGYEEITLVDRKPSGTFIIEAPALSSKDYFSIAKAGTTGALAITHGTVGGGKILLSCPRVSIGNLTYQDSQGVQMLSIPFVPAPSSGNDEISIAVK